MIKNKSVKWADNSDSFNSLFFFHDNVVQLTEHDDSISFIL